MDSQDNTGRQLDKQPLPEQQRRRGFSFSVEIGDGVIKMLLAVILVFVILGGRFGCASHADELAKPSALAATQPDEKATTNLVPGRWSPRHVAWLGETVPVVKIDGWGGFQ